VSNWVEGQLGGFATHGLGGQFLLDLLLGAVWNPCVGPTLGAVSILAAKGENLGQVALTMIAFGLDAALPLILFGLLSREALLRWRERLMGAGSGGKMLLGGLLIAIGVLVASGLDKRLETLLVRIASMAHALNDHDLRYRLFSAISELPYEARCDRACHSPCAKFLQT
jgi:cytochrome c-type biogenesis protein